RDLGVGLAGRADLDVRPRKPEVADEDVLERVVVVLARPGEREPDVARVLQHVDDPTRANEVGPDAEDHQDVVSGHERRGTTASRGRSSPDHPYSRVLAPCRRWWAARHGWRRARGR